MKYIKDYLHLYLGCEVQYPDVDGTMIVAKLTGVSRGDGVETTYIEQQIPGNAVGDYLAWEPNGYHNSDALHLKLLLRPLSDMREEEMRMLFKLMGEYNNAFHVPVTKISLRTPSPGCPPNIIDVTFAGSVGAGYSTGSACIYLNKLNAESHRYLLSKGFDLFGLIEAGLAIDKTKLSNLNSQIKWKKTQNRNLSLQQSTLMRSEQQVMLCHHPIFSIYQKIK